MGRMEKKMEIEDTKPEENIFPNNSSETYWPKWRLSSWDEDHTWDDRLHVNQNRFCNYVPRDEELQRLIIVHHRHAFHCGGRQHHEYHDRSHSHLPCFLHNSHEGPWVPSRPKDCQDTSDYEHYPQSFESYIKRSVHLVVLLRFSFVFGVVLVANHVRWLQSNRDHTILLISPRA